MPKLSEDAVAKIAEVMHEGMRAWQKANGQAPAPTWGRAPKWMKVSSIEAVHWRLKNPNASASAQHDRWAEQKKADGWKFGKTKSGVKKTHPMLVPYSALPEVERRKDALVNAVIDALTKPMR
jgi:RyR domain